MIAAMQKVGGKEVTLKVYPDEGNGAGRVVVASVEKYGRIFAHKRD